MTITCSRASHHHANGRDWLLLRNRTGSDSRSPDASSIKQLKRQSLEIGVTTVGQTESGGSRAELVQYVPATAGTGRHTVIVDDDGDVAREAA